MIDQTNLASNNVLNGLSILLVEDCPENQFLFERLLARKGADVVVEDDGMEGSNRALQQEFDIVLMDIEMPHMDGFAAIAKLKAAGYTKPVVALTAHTKLEDRERIESAGFCALVNKPIEGRFLLETIKRVLAK